MNREDILKCFGEEEKAEVLTLVNKMELAYNKDLTTFSSIFVTPNIWKTLESRFSSKIFKVESCGGFLESERRLLAFNNKYNEEFPLKVLKIKANAKFRNVEHKDFLGSIMALGIERNKIGDLIKRDDEAYLAVHEDIKDYIILNLEKIASCPCRVFEVGIDEEFPKISFDEEVILVSSLRLDNIVCKIANISRGKAQEYIKLGKVLLDYSKVTDKSVEVKKDDRITMRGYGKFILGDVVGNSKSGKFKIIIKKYT